MSNIPVKDRIPDKSKSLVAQLRYIFPYRVHKFAARRLRMSET
jgi:hypothetical protein